MRKLFETHDRLAEVDSANALLDRRLRVVDDAVVSQDTRFADGGWHGESLTLRLESGLPFSAELDQSTALLIRELDGSQTLRDALASAVDSEAAQEAGVAVARQMLAVGFLDFADVSSQA